MPEYLRIILTIPLLSALILSIEGCGKKEEPKAPAQAPAPTAEAKAPQLAPVRRLKHPQRSRQRRRKLLLPRRPQLPKLQRRLPSPRLRHPKRNRRSRAPTAETPARASRCRSLSVSSGGTVMLRFTMINDGDKDPQRLLFRFRPARVELSDSGTVSGVHLHRSRR